jgi:hypothetical protein
MALDLGEPMGVRSDAELSGARIALGEQRATGQARELTMAAALAAAAEAARRATGFICAERHLVAGAALSGGYAVALADEGANAVISVLPASYPRCRVRACMWSPLTSTWRHVSALT